MNKFGKWVQQKGGFTPGGTPYYVCGQCGYSGHLYGVEYPRRKITCSMCGSINSYPWESTYEQMLDELKGDKE